jgi:hypothetical protein
MLPKRLVLRHSKVCTAEIGCSPPPMLGRTICKNHEAHASLYGLAWAPQLRQRARRPYVCAAFAVLKALRRKKDTAVLHTLYELTATVKRCRLVPFKNWRGLKPKHKVESILAQILKRWPEGEEVALAISSVVVGVLLACRNEPELDRSALFARFQGSRALLSLVKTKTEVYEIETGKPGSLPVTTRTYVRSNHEADSSPSTWTA